MDAKKRTLSAVFLIVTGVALVLIANFLIQNSSLFGAGCAFICIGCIRTYQLFRYKTDANYAAERDINNHDERNLALYRQAQATTFVITAVGLAIAAIVTNLLGQELIAQVVSVVVSLMLTIFIATYWVIRTKS
ncbi:hypothetical protein [Atopobium fossor]|uniref:hypothetical protein n=1 Tax=Atopobium fossor TaxID=39487 RepID=UPI00040DC228|nr:hypothetical protein [Atopobium fossor]